MSRLTPSLLALDKGLDLQTAKIIAPEGSVFDTLNYEQVDFQGQKRIDGYTRYDGTVLPAINDYVVVSFTPLGNWSGFPDDVNTNLFIGGKLWAVAVKNASLAGDAAYVQILDHSMKVVPGDVLQVSGSSNIGTITSIVGGTEQGISVGEHYENVLELSDNLRSRVTTLPEPIAGLHWFKDRLYTVAGVQRFSVSPVIDGSFPDGYVGDSGTYQYDIQGGVGAKTVEVVSGSLPPSSSIDSSGLVTYTFTTIGNYSWTIRVTDSLGVFFDIEDSSTVSQENVWNSTLVFVDYVLSNSNKTVTQFRGGTNSGNQIAVSPRSSGKWYFEVQGTGLSTGAPEGRYGIGQSGISPSSGQIGSDPLSAGMGSHGFAQRSNQTSSRIAAPYPGINRCMVAFDADTGRLWFGVLGQWVNGGNPATGVNPFYTMPIGLYYPMVSFSGAGGSYTLLTKQSEMLYTPPTGFEVWQQT